jgi:ADP-ribosylation factor GTPase-activating protein 1
MAALGKGWSLFTAVAAEATKAVQENVIQPGMEKALDPNLRTAAAGYVSEASRRAHALAAGANDWGREQFGVDVAGKVNQTISNYGNRSGYGALSTYSDSHNEGNSYADDDDFFREATSSSVHQSAGTFQASSKTPSQKTPITKVDDDDDEWKDF